MDKTTQLYDVRNYSPISGYSSKVEKKLSEEDVLKGISSIPVIDPTAFLGIEVEVEGVKVSKELLNLVTPIWGVTPDGSLRNNGVEFVSVPIRAKYAHKSLELLRVALAKHSKYEFSERTSIHIHMNVRRLTLEQLFVLLITYLVVEKSLFQFVERCGVNRENNIFCVPITESKYHLNLDKTFKDWEVKAFEAFIENLMQGWKKYTALNLLPLSDKGTIEFRHMGGTIDVDLLMTWINLILSLKKFSYTTSLESLLDRINTLNSSSLYGAFLSDVFGRFSNLLAVRNYERDLEEGVSQVKDCLNWANRKEATFSDTPEEFCKTSFYKYLYSVGYRLIDIPKDDLLVRYKALSEEYQKILTIIQTTKLKEKKERYKVLLVDLGEKMKELRNEIDRQTINLGKQND